MWSTYKIGFFFLAIILGRRWQRRRRFHQGRRGWQSSSSLSKFRHISGCLLLSLPNLSSIKSYPSLRTRLSLCALLREGGTMSHMSWRNAIFLPNSWWRLRGKYRHRNNRTSSISLTNESIGQPQRQNQLLDGLSGVKFYFISLPMNIILNISLSVPLKSKCRCCFSPNHGTK